MFALEDRIIEAVEPIGGDDDGHEFGAGEAVLYTYGRDANELFDAVSGALGDFPLRPGALAIKRFGPSGDPSSREERVELSRRLVLPRLLEELGQQFALDRGKPHADSREPLAPPHLLATSARGRPR